MITATMTGTQSPVSAQDYWFGVLTSTPITSFSNTAAVVSKFVGNNNTNGGTSVACSPFNGPGGNANPSFTITLNGQAVSGRFQGVGAECMNGCTSVLNVDPALYTLAGAQYDVNDNLLGPTGNPFNFNQSYQYATTAHSSAAVANPAIPTDPTYDYGIQTANGVQTVGTFSKPVTILGVTKYQFTSSN